MAKRQGFKPKIFRFLGKYIAKNGYSPSYQEVVDGLKLSNKKLVLVYVRELADDGLITYEAGKSRTIKFTPKGRKYLNQNEKVY